MAKSKKQKELDEEFLRECRGYTTTDNKPDGAYIEVNGYFFNLNEIKRLIEAGADVNAKNSDGWFPLDLAYGGDSIVLAELLISAGAKVNMKDKMGWTLLHWAVQDRELEFAKLLVSAGANVNTKSKDSQRESPLEWVIREHDSELIDILTCGIGMIIPKEKEKINKLLFRECKGYKLTDKNKPAGSYYLDRKNGKFFNLDKIKHLIEAGADVNAKDEWGNSLLNWAISKDNEYIIHLLKQHGAAL